MNEVGFTVCKVESSGFLRFERVDGPAQVTTVESIVTLTEDKGPAMGYIDIRSHHSVKGDERTQSPPVDKPWVGIGTEGKDGVMRMGIQVGASVILYNPPQFLADDLVYNKVLDDCLGCTAPLGIADVVSITELDIAIYLMASIQGRFNIYGIVPVLCRVKPDLVISIGIALSCDTPDLHDYSEVRVNQGVRITCLNYHGRGAPIGLATPPRLMWILEQTALEHNIPVQQEMTPGVVTGISYIQVGQDSIPYANLSIPCRYTHSPVEVTSLRDLTGCIRLLTALADMSAVHLSVKPDSDTTQEAHLL